MAATDPGDDLAVTPAQVVEHEARRRPRTGLIALVAAIVTVIANVLQTSIFSDLPKVTPIDALRETAGESLGAGRTGLASEQALYLHHHASGLVIATILQALVYFALGYILLELLRMTLDRAGKVARPTRILVYVGSVLAGVGALARIIGLVRNAADFASSDHQTTAAAHDVVRNGSLLVGGTLVGQLGLFALAAAIVLVALAAMRVGLLPRFVGILGAIVGVLQILGPLSALSFVVTAFWLAMLGAMMLGRWPGGMPPAWDAGEAVPWPSPQEVREQRDAARGERGGGGGFGGGGFGRRGRPRAELPEPVSNGNGNGASAPATETPSPATSARKKRKRRG
ncbi:hypothetical protein [Conexibacter woesei]|uniref:hypothetical protein n=1 Tax=Conexibacter woesei TaxID=191495 RepID=UPI0004293786|nr:hypothetical protein [Conexibacter woesei]